MAIGENLYRLTDNEKQVLSGITRDPHLNDVELSKLLGIKRPTIATIRNKLENDGIFSFRYVFPPHAFNSELTTLARVNFFKEFPYYKRIQYNKGNPLVEFNESFLEVTQFNVFSLHHFKDYSEYYQKLYRHHNMIQNQGYSKSMSVFHFPNRYFNISSFFEMGPMVNHVLNLDHETKYLGIEKTSIKKNNINRNSALITSLDNNPNLSSSNIAKELGVSQSTVVKNKQSLIQNGYMMPRIIINWNALGCEIFGLYHIIFNTESSNDNKDLQKEVLNKVRPFFAIDNEIEACGFYITKSIDEYQRINHFFSGLVSKDQINPNYFTTFALIQNEIKKF